MKLFRKKTRLTAWQLLALGYLAVILFGSLLLILPFATKDGNTTYLNALFVSASATCVTGLVPYDTGTHWSLFGQIVILLLIQTGGLGFMTFVSVAVKMLGKNMGLFGKKALMASAGETHLSGLKQLIKRIVVGTLILEVVGAVLLSFRFVGDFGWAKGIYFAIWHSVSAFCNAGFDLFGSEFGQFSSLTHYATDPLVILTLSALIVVGGLGFCVWSDVIDTKFRWKNFRLHTKIVLSVSGTLLIASTLLFLLFERNNPECANLSAGGKLLVAIFNAVTPRTAGFNTTDLTQLSDSGYLLTVMLMFVGGCSGSTAGGVKLNTCAVIIMGMIAAFRGKLDVNLGKKRIDGALVSQALAIFVSCLFLVCLSTVAICAIEPSLNFKSALFETVSALGTVGLSLSVTPTLCAVSKVIIIFLMYAGRVGILTIALAFGENRSTADVRKPLDNTILIG